MPVLGYSALVSYDYVNYVIACYHYYDHRILESFEALISRFAQQLPPNASLTFTFPSLTLFVESVSFCECSELGIRIDHTIIMPCYSSADEC